MGGPDSWRVGADLFSVALDRYIQNVIQDKNETCSKKGQMLWALAGKLLFSEILSREGLEVLRMSVCKCLTWLARQGQSTEKNEEQQVTGWQKQRM